MPEFDIPTLCYLKEINEIGACRICVVEVEGCPRPGSCLRLPGSRGYGDQHLQPPMYSQARRTTLELILSTHDKKCLSCVRAGNCELQKLCREYERGR